MGGGRWSDLDDYLNTDISTEFLQTFYGFYHQAHPHRGLGGCLGARAYNYAMQKKVGKPEYKALTDRVINYIE